MVFDLNTILIWTLGDLQFDWKKDWEIFEM